MFADDPTKPAINGSLWTLIYEVVCYVRVFVLCVLGLRHRRADLKVAFAGIAAALLVSLYRSPANDPAWFLDVLAQHTFSFCLGVLAYV